MSKITKSIIVLIFLISAVAVILVKNSSRDVMGEVVESVAQKSLPRLLDLGSHSCVPCKMMMPILDTLREVYTGKINIEFIDVWENREAAAQYGIRAIPSQIIYDASGKELFRHEGFWSRKEIELKCEELGIIPKRES